MISCDCPLTMSTYVILQNDVSDEEGRWSPTGSLRVARPSALINILCQRGCVIIALCFMSRKSVTQGVRGQKRMLGLARISWDQQNMLRSARVSCIQQNVLELSRVSRIYQGQLGSAGISRICQGLLGSAGGQQNMLRSARGLLGSAKYVRVC